MLSDYCKQFKVKVGGVKKLIPTLKPKKSYVLHFKNLKLCTRLGLKITKIHPILAFNQSSWLKKYIDFNTEKQKIVESNFEKRFLQIMNNSILEKLLKT